MPLKERMEAGGVKMETNAIQHLQKQDVENRKGATCLMISLLACCF